MKNKKLNQFFDDLNHLNEINIHNLIKIIKDNKRTLFGRKYQFEELSSVEDYQRKVPLSTYDDYRKGNESAYPVKTILHTTGTTGHPKLINLTEEALTRYQGYIYELPKELFHLDHFISVHTSVFEQNKQPTILSAVYYEYLHQSGVLNMDNYVEKKTFLFSNENFPIPYVKLRLALIEENLTMIESIYLYEIDVFLEYLYKNWKLILNDLKQKKCSIDISNSIKEKLNVIVCKPTRILYLANLFQKYKGKPPINRIWPKLLYLSGIGQKNSCHIQRIKKYAPNIPIYYFAYASSECMCGIATKMDMDEYVLMPQSAFYEFLDEKQNLYLPSEVKVGEKYELIITTFSGFYRYQTNDILLITGFEKESPRFRVLGRKNKVLSIAGEKIDEWTIHEAMWDIIQMFQLADVEYMIGIDASKIPFGYIIFTNIPVPLFKEIEIQFDRSISSLNEIYGALRKKGFISMPKFLYFADFEKYKTSFKPKLILTEEEVLEMKEGL